MEPTKEHLLWMYEEQTVYLNERFQVAQKMRFWSGLATL